VSRTVTVSDPHAAYAAHVAARAATTARALLETGFDSLLIHSGVPFTYFTDDNDAPFHPTPHFAHWAPVDGPHHLLDVVPGKRPRLVRVQPRDFWYAPPAPATDFVRREFDVVEVATPAAAWKEIGAAGPRTAFIGAATEETTAHGIAPAGVNAKTLVARLDWERTYKSDWEVDAITAATAKAAPAHRAAEAAFRAGAPEIEIHHAYLAAVGDVEEALPYTTIVALDDRAATLHYHGKRGRESGKARVFLIDAGAATRGYACDITRTYVAAGADPVFARLLDGMKKMQARLCAEGRPGKSYVDLHFEAHRNVGALLFEAGVLRVSGDEAFARGLTHPFLPHGLGHFLGIQVHDVAGRQVDREGTIAPPPEGHPALRITRVIEERMLFTIEPGLYFIPMLLEPYRTGPNRDAFDWALVDRLIPSGGIRIEDNVLVGRDANRNLTRERLPD
jgi:Xaa-Pro dipeptidase